MVPRVRKIQRSEKEISAGQEAVPPLFWKSEKVEGEEEYHVTERKINPDQGKRKIWQSNFTTTYLTFFLEPEKIPELKDKFQGRVFNRNCKLW